MLVCKEVKGEMMNIDDLLKFVYGLAEDHKPDGWPAIQMQEITPLADNIVKLRAENTVLNDALHSSQLLHKRVAREWMDKCEALRAENEALRQAIKEAFKRGYHCYRSHDYVPEEELEEEAEHFMKRVVNSKFTTEQAAKGV